jgi:hypothetical protein
MFRDATFSRAVDVIIHPSCLAKKHARLVVATGKKIAEKNGCMMNSKKPAVSYYGSSGGKADEFEIIQ